ncbi:hypothetical protein DYB36_004413 [Aphanomyces astaci]|uniref:DNA repair protein REV1 n=1 Tax=Aphanomyces astaci TaxID=112090 RepID=A0A397AQN6_APHAT|nr:hypothetical protein DYB36_004413 [Aphanomyces astaci]
MEGRRNPFLPQPKAAEAVPSQPSFGQQAAGSLSFGQYMASKIQKLRTQNDGIKKSSRIFDGVAIYVNGHTEPRKEKLRTLILEHGGQFEAYQTSRVTHMIAEQLADSKLREIIFGEYMTSKIAKLRDQAVSHVKRTSRVLDGVVVYVNGHTHPSKMALRLLVLQHGGAFESYLTSQVTHVVATHLSTSKALEMTSSRKKKPLPVVHPQWIVDCVAQQHRLPVHLYTYSHMHPKYSPSSSGARSSHPITPSPLPPSVVGSMYDSNLEHMDIPGQARCDDVNLAQRSPAQQDISPPRTSSNGAQLTQCMDDQSSPVGSINLFPYSQTQPLSSPASTITLSQVDDSVDIPATQQLSYSQDNDDGPGPGRDNTSNHLTSPSTPSHPHHDAANDAHGGWTHAIDEQELEITTSQHAHDSSLDSPPPSQTQVLSPQIETRQQDSIDTIEKDQSSCNHHHLIAHNQSRDVAGTVDAATAAAGMPPKVTPPATFRPIKSTKDGAAAFVRSFFANSRLHHIGSWKSFYMQHVAEFTSTTDMSTLSFGSCDKVDRVILHVDMDCFFVSVAIRHMPSVYQTLPVAVAHSGLATKQAKPNNVFEISSETASDHIHGLSVRDLPGWSDADLGRHFGAKTSVMLRQFARGKDTRPLELAPHVKSISADVNYGVRLADGPAAIEFVRALGAEVHSRLVKAGFATAALTLKLKIRHPDAPIEPAKYMGHGRTDDCSKSTRLPAPTNDVQVIEAACVTLLNQLKIVPHDLRGAGVQASRLTRVVQNQSNKMDNIHQYFTAAASQDIHTSVADKRQTTEGTHHRPMWSVPTLSQIDPDVLNTLPEALRREILHQVAPPTVPTSYSQIDQSVLNALPKPLRDEIQHHFPKTMHLRQCAAYSKAKPPPTKPAASGRWVRRMSQVDAGVWAALPPSIQSELLSEVPVDTSLGLSERSAAPPPSCLTMDTAVPVLKAKIQQFGLADVGALLRRLKRQHGKADPRRFNDVLASINAHVRQSYGHELSPAVVGPFAGLDVD